MKRERFVRERGPDWERFEQLLKTAEDRRRPKLSGDEVSELSRLFRALCYDLSLVRSKEWGLEIERYLNGLVARGHNCFYRSRPAPPREYVMAITHHFPRLLRQNAAYFWVALVLFVLPGLISGTLVYRDPSLAGRVLTGHQRQMLEEMYSSERPFESSGKESAMAGFYVRNNVGIAFRCFATGILFGLGTMFFLVFNSIFLGTVTGYLLATGHSDRFVTFVFSHGSFELTAIVVSGAAGLILGHALAHPGPFDRWDAVRRRGLVAVQLALGAGAMLCVAALIEAFWSPSGLPKDIKLVGGGLFWVAVVLYLTLGGRKVEAS